MPATADLLAINIKWGEARFVWSLQFLLEFGRPARKSDVEHGGHLVAPTGTAAYLILILKVGYSDFGSSGHGMMIKEARFSSHLILIQ